MQTAQATDRGKPIMGCGYAMVAFIGVMALGALRLAQVQYRRFGAADKPEVLMPLIAGIALLGGAVLFLFFTRKAMRDHEAEEARRMKFPGQPWKWKKEWIGPVIEAKVGTAAVTFWVFAIFWNALSMPAAWIVLHAPRQKPGMLFVLIFPVVGVLILAGAVYQTVRWRKYGRVSFRSSSLPGVIGGYLNGMIEVPARVLPEREGRVRLRCVRRESRGSGKNRSTTEKVLWEHEEVIAAGKWTASQLGTRIPVLVYIPTTCLATDEADRDNEIVWKLSADAETPGVDFATEFVVPVFATGETAPPPEPGRPVLGVYSRQPVDEAALRKCGVLRVTAGFDFNTGHLKTSRTVTAFLTLGLLALMGWFAMAGVPVMAWVIALFFAGIIGLFAVSVWFGSYELRLVGEEVVVTKLRPWGTKTTRVRRADVKRIETHNSMSSGDRQYYRLSLMGEEGANPDVVQEGEPFAIRKLRYRLTQLEKRGQLPPDKVRELNGELLAEFKNHPKFVVTFASFVPGQTKAEAVADQVLQLIRGGK